ncbi:MAG: hypothetical protein KF833_05535 [Verrucomicrobiae bacterium]|nr:hypothetical protein [Verrucomicrobiae bacterium]
MSGESVILAGLQDTFAQQVASNVVVYPDSFRELHASIRYIYEIGSFHQDVILHEAPPSPQAFGLSDRSRLEVITEFGPDTPEPERFTRFIRVEENPAIRRSMVEPDFTDHLLVFGQEIRMLIGRAFALDEELNDGAGGEPGTEIPVGKEFQRIDGRTRLIEGVEYQAIAPFLEDLPPATADLGEATRNGESMASSGRLVPARIASLDRGHEFARREPSQRGFVLDYVTKTGGATDFNFVSKGTYYISSGFGVSGYSIAFGEGAVIKYANNAYLYLYGHFTFPSSGSPVVFTSKDENLYGEVISGSTGSPAHMANPALWVYYVDFNTEIRNASVRWAKQGVVYDQNPGVSASHSVRDSKFKNTQTGVVGGWNSPTVSLTNIKRCNVTTPTSGCCIGGSMTLDCEGDNDYDELPDSWEVTYFGNTSAQNGHGDPDGDGLINFKEYLFGTSPNLADSDSDGLGDLLEYELSFNVLVNSPAADYGKEQNSQFESTCAVLNGNVVVAYVDSNSGVYALGQSSLLTSYTPRMVGYAVSEFGGAVFVDKGVPPLSTQGSGTSDDGDAGDPVLAVDTTGSLVYLVGTSPRNAGHKGIPLWKSTNGGVSFGTPALICGDKTQTDKPWITVDNATGTGQRDVYVTFTTFGPPQKLWLTVSTDYGANWNTIQEIAASVTNGQVQSAIPVVDANHVAYVFWLDSQSAGGGAYNNYIKFRKVQSRGASVGSPQQILQTVTTGEAYGDLALKRSNSSASNDTFRVFPFPVPAANPSSSKAGHLYVAYADKGTGSDRADVFFVCSSNGGASWTSPLRVNSVASNDQWMPVIAVKPDGTRLFVAWYDRRNDSSNNSLIDVYGRWGTIASGGSVTFGTEFRITTQSFPPVFAGTLAANKTNGHYDPVYPPGGVNLHWHYPEWDDDVLTVTEPAYQGHVGEYNGAWADSSYVYVTWTDYRLTAQGTLYGRNQSDIRFARLTWPQ